MNDTTLTRVVLFGASGRMGTTVVDALSDDPLVSFAGSVRRLKNGTLEALSEDGGVVDMATLLNQADAAIDFSLPEAVAGHLALSTQYGVPYACGVTGLDAPVLAKFSEAATTNAVLWAPNMSTGVTICFGAAADIASRLGRDFEVSVLDIHHEGKKDAPSGTALEFGRVIEAASSGPVKIVYESVREGAHPGEHHVVFRAGSDVIELRHLAGNRREFAAGAVMAARWLASQPPGFYNMRNVLGITSSS